MTKVISMNSFLNKKLDEKLDSSALKPIRLKLTEEGKVTAQEAFAPGSGGAWVKENTNACALVEVKNVSSRADFLLVNTVCFGMMTVPSDDFIELLYGKAWVKAKILQKNLVTGERQIEINKQKYQAALSDIILLKG